MTLTALLMCASLALGSAAQDPAPPERKPVVVALETGLASAKASERIAAIRALGEFEAPELAPVLATALADSNRDVVLASIDALGLAKTGAAFEELRKYHQTRRVALRKEPDVLPRLLNAVARHRDERAIEILTDDVLGQTQTATLRARLLGLGWVRSKRSAEALLTVMNKLGFAEQVQYLEDFRLSFVILTGVDQGKTLEAWSTWWSKNKSTFEIPKAPPKPAAADETRWNAYWNLKPKPAR